MVTKMLLLVAEAYEAFDKRLDGRYIVSTVNADHCHVASESQDDRVGTGVGSWLLDRLCTS